MGPRLVVVNGWRGDVEVPAWKRMGLMESRVQGWRVGWVEERVDGLMGCG